VPEECVGHEDDVGRVRHREEQVEGLPLESFVRVLEALDDDHLVVERVLLVDLWGEERERGERGDGTRRVEHVLQTGQLGRMACLIWTRAWVRGSGFVRTCTIWASALIPRYLRLWFSDWTKRAMWAAAASSSGIFG
jgi:hypothetical protein